MDGVEAFHAAYYKGRVVRPPNEYMDTILIPSILHTPTREFHEQPFVMQERTRRLLLYYIAGGWAGNTHIIKSEQGQT